MNPLTQLSPTNHKLSLQTISKHSPFKCQTCSTVYIVYWARMLPKTCIKLILQVEGVYSLTYLPFTVIRKSFRDINVIDSEPITLQHMTLLLLWHIYTRIKHQ